MLAVVIEISNSQTNWDLAYLADQHVVETSEYVNVVIGIKLDSGRTPKAELSLWRPQYAEEGPDNVFGIRVRNIFRGKRRSEELMLVYD